ncbi:AAA family ATPase [Ruminococcus sp. AF17-22AC]|uniref:HelD family protein n=1 Tax=Clostridia TaxID=186801 RepID=UPI000E4E99AD|nr:UvrD-helicase domain-containing protein [Ruminococcus sp. AF17-22AC]RGU31931.1 AAA family ATPase [Ruminococcus sp. AF17-22AC]
MENIKNGREYLQYVLKCLNDRLAQADAAILEGEKEIEDMHEYYWENYTEMDQYGYEDYDNQQALFRQMNANEEQFRLRKRFKKMQDSPFFGRVDFRYDGDEEAETFYIGIGNLSESAGSLPLVYDWRAPVSGLFYDYDKGPASYEAPSGIFEGEVTSKWQYKIRKGKMLYEFESDVKIDDEILGAELGSNGEVQLKNIVRTIQKEQNEIIRNTKDKIMVIQGAAGSGKTSVALHRIAYLLYHDRENLKSSNVLILSPNGVFADYISHILPELGEENIREMSFDLFAYRELKEIVGDCEDRYDQIERTVLNPKIQEICREKQSPEFVSKLDGFVLRLEDELMNFRDVEYRGCTLSEKEIIDLFYFKFLDVPLLSRMHSVAEYFIDQVETLRDRDLSDEEREEVMECFRSMYETRDCYVLYSRFLEKEGYRPLPHCQIEKRRLRYEDVYPVLYLKYTLYQCRNHHGIKHVVVDEMQDYSWIQYLLIHKMFPCRMTILGDKAQTMEDETQDVLKFLPKIFGKDIRKIVMNRSYRNTMEVAQYANHLTGIEDMELFERHGEPVDERTFSSTEEALETVLEKWLNRREEFETEALIFLTEREAEHAFLYIEKRLKEIAPEAENQLCYMNRDSQSFKKGLTVTTFYLAKGLEFDQVFGIFEEDRESGLQCQAKYITATRALHELHMYMMENSK